MHQSGTGKTLVNMPIVNSLMYPANQTVNGASYTVNQSNAIPVNGAKTINFMFNFTGVGGSSGIVTFYIAISLDGVSYESIGTPFPYACQSSTPVSFIGQLNTTNALYVKCIKITNADASAVSNVNIMAYAGS